ncbi:TonB-dependent receptor plug domain-containing protein [Peristeroidobacter soli]|jgi:iron complex outermembrane receptor protein|uniref:TonB-dependent receptor plug domain-containing protein n=1 Tax=Peristeroidobacter soli TaxID=2497877 RepID=UPI00101CF08A|nr:TonB-dependent receptor plug domain-containing protein [Peristeroidobacter soli]
MHACNSGSGRSNLGRLIRSLLWSAGAASLLPALSMAQTVPDQNTEVLDTITVTGSSIRTQAAALDTMAQPIQFVSEEQFQNTPAESIGDFLRTMPINTGLSNSPTTDEYAGGNSSINLRGIGDQYTLVLVEGRRFGGEDVPDIGAVPAEAIKGIEILKGGASSIYGSDAVAGVVNIRLKENFSGLELHGSYGDTSRGDQSFVRTAAVFGLTEDKFSLTGSLSYQKRDGLTKFDRDLTASRDYRAYGGLDRRSGRVSLPHQIVLSSDPTHPLSLDLSRFNAGSYSSNPADYVAFSRDQAYSTNELGTSPPYDRMSGHWSAKYRFIDDKLVFFTRGYADRRHQDFYANPPIIDVAVPAANPYNPFGQDVHVWYLFGPNELGYMTETFRTTNFLGTAGFEGTLGRFNYEVAYSSYQKRVDESYRNDIDYGAAQAAAARTDATAFNPFGYWANTPAQLEGLSPTSTYERENAVRTVDAKVDGELFDWYAGTAYFAVGVEKRIVDYDFQPDESWQSVSYWWLGNAGDPISQSRDVKAYFGEVRLPVFDAGSEGAFVQSAELTGAVRKEEYSDFGSSTVTQFTGRIAFADERVVLRASYAESFKAPSLDALYSPVTSNTEPGGFYYDPVRGGFLPVDRIQGGNVGLDPELGETINLGLIVRPMGNSDLVFTLDYWTLELTDLISQPDGQALLNGQATGGTVTRDPVTLYPTLDLRLDNGGNRDVSGFDLGASYRLPTGLGTFTLDFNGTYLTKFEDSNNGITAKYLGTYNTTVGPMPRLRLVNSVQWAREGWNAVTTISYTGGYEDEILNVIKRDADAYVKVDLQGSYDFGDGHEGAGSLLNGTRVYLGIENVFDEDLPFVAESSDGWDRYIADYRGRYVYAGFKKQF